MLKQLVRKFLLLFSKPISSFIDIYHHLRNHNPKIVFIGAKAYNRELLNSLNELGYFTIFIDPKPENLNWLYAKKVYFFDPYDKKPHGQIINLTRKSDFNVVLMQSDDNLLPSFFAINQRLGHEQRFQDLALQCSLHKHIMRKTLKDAGRQHINSYLINAKEDIGNMDFPVVAKANTGQGSLGARLCENKADIEASFDSVKAVFPNSSLIVETYLEGRQFNVDGLIKDGEFLIYGIQEENYERHHPNIMPCWYLFNPDLNSAQDPQLKSRIEEACIDALKICGFKHGAFHSELRVSNDKAVTIDFSNRMGADFPKYVKLTTGRDQIADYINLMTDQPIQFDEPTKNIKALRYYNYKFDSKYDEVQKIAAEMENQFSKLHYTYGKSDCTILEMEADNEAPLREFLRRVAI